MYESLQLGVSGVRSYQSGSSLVIPSPIWLFQLLLLATFREKLKVFIPTDLEKAHENRATEGLGLAMLRCENWGSKDLFSITYEALSGCDTFNPLLAPFSNRTRGTDWFTRKFPAHRVHGQNYFPY